MKHRELQFPGCQEASLFAQAWLPERAPRAIVVISHGLGEHGGRYAPLASRLVEKGYAVYALDHRGHGRSSGPRANIERFDYLVSDLGVCIGRAQREHLDTPVILLGHSMGGAVALACALKYEKVLRALVLSAPALAPGDAVPAFKLLVVKALSALSPNTGALTLPATAVSRDPAVVRAYESDPLVFHGAIPARTLAELLQAMQRLQAKVHELRLPVLIQHGTADSLVPLAAAHPIYQHLGQSKRRTLMVYEGLYHEVYNEPERDRVIGDLEAWLAS
ncbi:MAG: alpha/beta hydrolase [Gammaproteobacteria bacterium]|nr:alpha/beta hydrolase [Gammaproteobacteria bacterium]